MMNCLYNFFRMLPLLLVAGGTFLVTGCFKTNVTPGVTNVDTGVNVLLPITTILSNNPDYSDFDSLLKRSELYQKVTGDSAYTFLIPTNAAFAASSVNVDSLLLLSADSLQPYVGYYILAGSIPTASVPQNIDNPFTTISGQTIYFSKPIYADITYNPPSSIIQGEATLNVNGVQTNRVDLAAQGGDYIQELAGLLSPPYPSIQAFLSAHPEYSLYVASLKQFKLWNQLDSAGGVYTIYAPVNSAFTRNGIDSAMVNSDTFNTSHYASFLFTCGIVPGRIFSTDFTDAAGQNNSTVAVYNANGTVQFNLNGNYSPPSLVAYSWNANPYCCGGFEQIGGNPGYTMKDQPVKNGVINGIDDLLVYPQYEYIAQ